METMVDKIRMSLELAQRYIETDPFQAHAYLMDALGILHDNAGYNGFDKMARELEPELKTVKKAVGIKYMQVAQDYLEKHPTSALRYIREGLKFGDSAGVDLRRSFPSLEDQITTHRL